MGKLHLSSGWVLCVSCMMNGCVSWEASRLTRNEDVGEGKGKGKSCSTDPVDGSFMQERGMGLD